MKILTERPEDMSFEDYKKHLAKQKVYIKMKQQRLMTSDAYARELSTKKKK